jgi:uncharacterized cupin superfamily protein
VAGTPAAGVAGTPAAAGAASVDRVNEATIEETETGKIVKDDGWFILNLAEASWERNQDLGIWCNLGAPDAPFTEFGIGPHVLMPGQPNARYHAEDVQEGFLVLAGECIAIVEGEERRMRQWDYLHCPPGTYHITVGAGDGPCVILMVGTRRPDIETHYPVNDIAARYGASSPQDTDSSKVAYSDVTGTETRERAPWPPIP